MAKAKVLFLDLETAPSLGWVWGRWEQNVLDVQADWYILSFGWKWQGERRAHVIGLNDFGGYSKNRENDRQLVELLWKLMDRADIIVAHNGDSFDIKKANARFLFHELPPPSPYRTVDTKKLAKKFFRFDSNKLDDLGRYLKIGRKVVHKGFVLWQECMAGDPKAWREMKTYNRQDVDLLEKIYDRLLAWATNHPNILQGEANACPKCGSADIQRRGYSFTLHRRKQRYQCQACGGWFEGTAQNPRSKE